MTYDFHAHYPFALMIHHQFEAYQWLAGDSPKLPSAWRELEHIEDPIARFDLLAQAIATPVRDRARTGVKPNIGGYRRWVEQDAATFLQKRRQLMHQLGQLPTLPPVGQLPAHAWTLQLPFTLLKPYISRDDQTFHLLDNPLKKDHIFRVPYIAASQWKGALRATFRQLDIPGDKTIEERLFGNAKGEDQHFQNGYLHFFPTFFDRLGLEVLNPHDRKSNVGKRGPILYECAPVGAKGVFQLIYAPTGAPTPEEITADLQTTARAMRAMLTQHGFGAKTSSGYGLAHAKTEEINLQPESCKTTFIQAWNQAHV